jgi:hypothetical protein
MFKKGRIWYYSSVAEAIENSKIHKNLRGSKRFVDRSGERHGNMQIICFAGMTEYSSANYVCKCLACDSGHYVVQGYSGIRKEGRTCGCSFVETESIAKRLREVGWDTLDSGDGTTKTRWMLECPNGHIKMVFPSNILHNNYGCQTCSGRDAKTLENVVDEVNKVSGDCYFISLESEFSGVTSFVRRGCKVCGKDFVQQVSNILSYGSGCPSCARYGFKQTEPAYFYIQKLTSVDKDLLKFGVTNNHPDKRMKQQQSKSAFIHQLLYSAYLGSGRDIIEIESQVKCSIPCSVVSKDLLPDGYTETCEVSQLETILEIINEKITKGALNASITTYS